MRTAVLIHVGSVTNAMRGKKILESHGIRAFVYRDSHPAAGDGCGYSLQVTEEPEHAAAILRHSGVRVIRVDDDE